jgi:hypothetical protein
MDETDHLDSKTTADTTGSSNADRSNEMELTHRWRERALFSTFYVLIFNFVISFSANGWLRHLVRVRTL